MVHASLWCGTRPQPSPCRAPLRRQWFAPQEKHHKLQDISSGKNDLAVNVLGRVDSAGTNVKLVQSKNSLERTTTLAALQGGADERTNGRCNTRAFGNNSEISRPCGLV